MLMLNKFGADDKLILLFFRENKTSISCEADNSHWMSGLIFPKKQNKKKNKSKCYMLKKKSVLYAVLDCMDTQTHLAYDIRALLSCYASIIFLLRNK